MASASSATRLTNSIAPLKFSNFRSRVSQSPSRLQSARRERESWICSSFSFICILQESFEIVRSSAFSRLVWIIRTHRLKAELRTIGKTNNQIGANVRTRNAACTIQRALYRLSHQIAEMKEGPPYSKYIGRHGTRRHSKLWRLIF